MCIRDRGSSAHAAIRLGEKNEEEAERTLNTAFSFSILLSVVLMVLGLLFLRPLLRAFGATDSILPYALDYTSIILLGTPFNMVSVVLSNLARTDGHPRMSMYGMMIGAFLNTILDPIYIFVLHWGVKGAAIATITSQIISAVVLTLYFLLSLIHISSLLVGGGVAGEQGGLEQQALHVVGKVEVRFVQQHVVRVDLLRGHLVLGQRAGFIRDLLG